MNHDQEEDAAPPGFWRSPYAIGLLVLGGIATYFLLTKLRAHFFVALPLLLLLACPPMHVFMHHGHGKHGGGHACRHVLALTEEAKCARNSLLISTPSSPIGRSVKFRNQSVNWRNS